jgi:hypothetical protein
MSATLVVAIPLALLGIVALLGFVGCGQPFTTGPAPVTDYSTGTVLNNPQCVAYWPLRESNKTDPAHDLTMNHNDGTYVDMSVNAALYPWPASAGDQSADAGNGKLLVGQPGIVAGDQVDGMQATCMVVNGAFVRVDNKSVFNPAQFTVEAWVRVDWASTDPVAIRMVVDSREHDATSATGFAIAAIPDPADGTYHWTAIVGNGPSQPATPPFTFLKANDAIILSDQPKGMQPVYLVMTLDGSGKLTLFVDGDSTKGNTLSGINAPPNTTQPLLIGAGGAFAGFRGAGGTGPLWPFVGAIQDVAIYKAALLSADILTHSINGRGGLTPG